ncbi:MAG: hypothetical protein WC508_03280 [Patescibacteria group bacterium]
MNTIEPKPIRTLVLKAHEIFVASERFIVGDSEGLRISEITDLWRQVYMKVIERNIPEKTAEVYPNGCKKKDTGINLAHVYDVLLAQGHGQDGLLEIDGTRRPCHVTGVNNFMLIVSWENDGWKLDARAVVSVLEIFMSR